MGTGDLSSGSYACTASALLSEPTLQPDSLSASLEKHVLPVDLTASIHFPNPLG